MSARMGSGTKIFEGLGQAEANLSIVATHVRHGESGENFVLRDGQKLTSIMEKWQFSPKSDPLSRCGYDYQMLATNGDTSITASICFKCDTLVLNQTEKYKINKRQILALLTDDFDAVS